MRPVQNYARDIIVEDIKKKLDTELEIKRLKFQPFNVVELDSVYLYDRENKPILLADEISAKFDLFHLLQSKLVISSARISDFEINLSKKDNESPLNIQFIIDAFKPKEPKQPSPLEVNLNSVSIVNGTFNYDVDNQPSQPEKFDVNHIRVLRLNTRLSLKSLKSDSLNIYIKKLNLQEKSGIEINNFSARLITQDKKASIKGFRLDLPDSSLKLVKCDIDATPTDSSNNILDYLKFNIEVAPSYISPKDISVLVPALHNFKDLITLEANIAGSVDNIHISDLSLVYGEKSKLIANAEIRDIRDKKQMYILGSIENFTIVQDEMERLVNNFSDKQQTLPKFTNEFGTITFEGDLSGYLSQLTAFGSLTTDIGTVKTDILFGFNSQKNIKSYVEGKIYTDDLNLKRLFNNNDLDKLAFSLGVHFSQNTNGIMQGNVDGTIHRFYYKGHTYKDIVFDTDYRGLRGLVNLKINDNYGSLNLDGLFDFSDKEKPVLNLVVNAKNIQLDSLHLADNMKQSYLSFNIDANFSGKNIDQAEGYINIDSVDFIREDKHFVSQKFRIETGDSINEKYITISSKILNGNIHGKYSLKTLSNSLKETLLPYISVLEEPEKTKKEKKKTITKNGSVNDLQFEFNINNTDSLSGILNLPVTIISQAKVTGFYNNIINKFKMEVFAPSLIAAGKNIKSGYVSIENPKNEIISKLSCLIVGNNNTTNEISLKSTLTDNNITTNIAFENNNKLKAKGNFSLLTVLSKDKDDKLQVDIDIKPSELILNGMSWKMNKSHACLYGDRSIEVNNFIVNNDNGSQSAKINGTYSPYNIADILKVELKNIDLGYIFETLAIDALHFGGLTTGNVFVSSVEGKPYANTRLFVNGFSFNGTDLGSLNLFSELEEETNRVILDGTILSKENKTSNVKGYIDPINSGLYIGIDADSIDIGFIEHYTSSLFDKVSGRGTGQVVVSGNFSKVTVEGNAYIRNGLLGVNFLNTTYAFSDSIHMKKGLIYFNNLSFKDQNNNVAIASGKIVHDHFADFLYYVNLSADNFLLYNGTEKQNPIFYGKVFGSGNGEISGDMQDVNIDIRMRTENNTHVFMNFMQEQVNEYSFITYKDKNAPEQDGIQAKASAEKKSAKPIVSKSGMGINMNFYIDATPDAVVELIMDPVGGDVLKGSGSGAMQFVWSTKASPQLYGNFVINRGSYNFTFQRLMERKFTIEDGSNVQFMGDPFGAVLDVKAIYKLTANLRDLDNSLVENSGQTNIPVNCILHLSGMLRHPNVGLDIAFPSSDAEIERQIKNLINTEDMINKQVAYLLILSKFYTPDYANTNSRTSDFAAVASATLSNQLSKIISQIDSRWQVGTNIRYSDADFTNTEVELVLSSQLLNDRLIINGNFGYREDKNRANNQDNFIGNVDVEYLLNNAGSWRIKGYNHYNEKYYYTETAVQTQGIGLMYKRDFDRPSELFRRKRKNKPLPTDTIKPTAYSPNNRGYLNSFVKVKQ